MAHSPAICVQSAGVLGEIVGVPAASIVAMIRSLRLEVSEDDVPMGRAGVALVPLAVSACDPER